MSFQRLSEGVEGKSRPPQSEWKAVPQSRTGGRETRITEFGFLCSRHEQLPHVIAEGPHWATTHVRRAAAAAVDRYLLSARRSAANPPQRHAAGE